MPWKTCNVMDQRIEFVTLDRTHVLCFKELCKKFAISRTTGYKWLNRTTDTDLVKALEDRSKRPKNSPTKTLTNIEEKFVALRCQYPYWGARKLMVLFNEQNPHLTLPSERTVNRIFARNNLLAPESPMGKAYKRFEYEQPNELWQMDYKGEFLYDQRHYCYPLNILDDHSRFNLALDAHERVCWKRTQTSLMKVFQQYGLPQRILMDRGTAWYKSNSQIHWTQLTVWLMRLGIELMHSRARHPQTLGKTERLNRTLKYDLIQRTMFKSFNHIQQCFDIFRYEYNYIRPHEAISLKRPAQLYTKSNTPFPEKLPTIEYPQGALVRKLSNAGTLFYKSRYWFISEALPEQLVALHERGDETDVYFVKTLVKTINLKEQVTY